MSALAVLLFAAATLRITVPYALAAAGASLGERGGVVCLGLEGFMLNSALAYVLGAWYLHDPWLALLCAVLAGVATAGLHALVTVAFRADQITSGIGINLLAAGLTRFVLVTVFHSSSNSPRVPGLPELPLGPLSNLPGLGPLLADTARAAHARDRARRRVARIPHAVRAEAPRHRRAARGECRAGARRWRRLRASGVLLCGALSGLAGAWLASEQHCFTDGMTGGRGYIAIAAMIVGKWHPAGAAAACLLFGATEAAQIALQGSGFPSALLQALPYAVTMLALAGIHRARHPAARTRHALRPRGSLSDITEPNTSDPRGTRPRDAFVAAIRARTALVPRVALTLGSGLGGVVDAVAQATVFSTRELPHWPVSTVPGHAGRLALGTWRGVPVAALSGRSHRYEGYPLDRVTFSVRVLAALGARVHIFTNAVGAIREDLRPADVMLATGHLNFIGKRGLLTPDELRERERGPPRRRTLLATAAHGTARGREAGRHHAPPGRPDGRPRPLVRDRGRGADGAHAGRGRGVHEHGARGDARRPAGLRGGEPLVRHQSRHRTFRHAAHARRRHGGRRPGGGEVAGHPRAFLECGAPRAGLSGNFQPHRAPNRRTLSSVVRP